MTLEILREVPRRLPVGHRNPGRGVRRPPFPLSRPRPHHAHTGRDLRGEGVGGDLVKDSTSFRPSRLRRELPGPPDSAESSSLDVPRPHVSWWEGRQTCGGGRTTGPWRGIRVKTSQDTRVSSRGTLLPRP